MTVLGIKAEFEILRTINSTGFNNTYQSLGTPLLFPSVLLYILNASGVLIIISDDGTNDKVAIAAGGFLLIDISSDAPQIEGSGRLFLSAGTQISVKGASASTGLVYLSSMYQGG